MYKQDVFIILIVKRETVHFIEVVAKATIGKGKEVRIKEGDTDTNGIAFVIFGKRLMLFTKTTF